MNEREKIYNMVNKHIKMVGLDMDGTLLTSQKTITDYTKQVIAKAIEQGCYVLLATGRPVSAIPEHLLHFPGMKYAVTTNGARIINVETGECVHECLLSIEKATKALNILQDYDTLTEVFVGGIGYTDSVALEQVEHYVSHPSMADYFRNTRYPEPDLKGKIKQLGKPLDKLQGVFCDMKQQAEAIERLRKIPDIEITSALGNNLEVNAVGADKGLGLLKLGEILGIKREEIMACGDGTNDSSMLIAAGLGVAMENAPDCVKEIADYITDTNDEDGVAKAIEKFVLK